MSLPHLEKAEYKKESRASTTESGPPQPLAQLAVHAAIAEVSTGLRTGEIQGQSDGQYPLIASVRDVLGSNAHSQTLPVGFHSLPVTSADSQPVVPTHNPPNPAVDIAFSLRLTWQPPASDTEVLMANPSRLNAAASVTTFPGHTMNVHPTTDRSGDLSEGTRRIDAVAEEAKSPLPDLTSVAPNTSTSRGGDGSANSRSFLSRPPESEQLVRQENAKGSVSESQGPAAVRNPLFLSPELLFSEEVTASPTEVHLQPQNLTDTPLLQKASATFASPSLPTGGQQHPAPETGVRTEAPSGHGPSQRGGRTESLPPLPLPTPSLESFTGPRRGASENTGRDTAVSESSGKGIGVRVAEKPRQIPTGPEHLVAATGDVSQGCSPESRSAPLTRRELPTAESPRAPTAPRETITTGTVLQPTREISLHIAGAASANVDIQVAQRGGKVQVAVRTADQELAKSLQTNLGELVGRLEEKGFRTEAWTPVTAQHPGGPTRVPANPSDPQNHPGDSGQRGGQSDSRQGQQESNPRQQGRWKAKLQEVISAPNPKTSEEEKR
jgi:hypothetical protein